MIGKNIDKRNATASWSGYLHQGKVGIFVALKEIVRLLSEGKNKEGLKTWRVIYENAEDFDIQEKDEDGKIEDKDGTKWRVESRHQVKAYKDGDTFEKYEDVLGIQKYEMVEKQYKKSKKIKKSLIIKGFQIKYFKDTGIIGECDIGEIEVDENSRFLHTIVSIPNFKGKNTDNPEINHYSNNPNNVKLFEYNFPNENDKHCELSTENSLLKDESLILIKKIKGDNKIGESKYLELLFILDEEVRKKHINGGFPEVSFEKIINLIQSDEKFEKYEEARFRNTFTKYWEKYKIENDIADDSSRINILNSLYIIEWSDFKDFLQNIHPDIKNIISDNDSNLNTAGLLDVYFHGIFEIMIDYSISELGYKKNGEKYILTTITRNNNNVSKDIIENGKITKILFEGNYIINQNMEGKLDEKISKLSYFKEKNINWDINNYSIGENNLFLNPKKLEFIKIEDVISKLNNK